MKKINDGGPAFPRPQAETSQGGNYHQDGMSIRDWFAGQALAHDYTGDEGTDPAKIALWAYQVADAMLAARAASND